MIKKVILFLIMGILLVSVQNTHAAKLDANQLKDVKCLERPFDGKKFAELEDGDTCDPEPPQPEQ